jgi:hypothetical protein
MGSLALGMQDIERAESRLMTYPAWRVPAKLSSETSRIDWFHKCIDLSIGRPKLYPISLVTFCGRDLYPAVVLEILHTT